MKYRKFNKINVEVSPIGFGCMRFPVTDPADKSTIVKEEATRMLRHAIRLSYQELMVLHIR